MQHGKNVHLAALAAALLLPAGAALAGAPSTTSATLPAGWTAQDIAQTKPATAGSTTVNAPLSGSPADMIWTVTGTPT